MSTSRFKRKDYTFITIFDISSKTISQTSLIICRLCTMLHQITVIGKITLKTKHLIETQYTRWWSCDILLHWGPYETVSLDAVCDPLNTFLDSIPFKCRHTIHPSVPVAHQISTVVEKSLNLTYCHTLW